MNIKTYFYKLQNRSNLIFYIAIVSAVSFYFISLDEKKAALHMGQFQIFLYILAQNTT